MERLEAHLCFYADLITASAGAGKNERLRGAFATPGERFVGPGPWRAITSFGSKVLTSSEQSIRTQRVNSLQTARREELRVDSVNLAEGGGMAIMARASERITPPNRSVSAK